LEKSMADIKQNDQLTEEPILHHKDEKTGYKKHRIRRDNLTLEKILPMIKGLGCICGGYARYVCSVKKKPELPGDIDIFPFTDEKYIKLLEIFKNAKMKIRKEKRHGSFLFQQQENIKSILAVDQTC
jgi:hypothetical protein